jgi:Peptidase S7, Flavivirus NS3 serine protease
LPALISQPSFLTAAVVQIGSGRGFVVGAADDQCYVITAAHCLPRSRYPFPDLANSTQELAFRRIIGPLGSKRSKHSICGELCVLSLTDDVAVFAAPDNQALWDEADRYQRFTATAMSLGHAPPLVPPYEWDTIPGSPAWVLSLDLQWLPCTVHSTGRFLGTSGVNIEGGMSGSPILNADGAAIGLISTSGGHKPLFDDRHPNLAGCLPPWLSHELMGRSSAREE